jgi:hypothetical protein
MTTTDTDSRWVHTLSHHPIGSVIGWPDAASPTGWLSGIVREAGPCCVRVDSILPGIHPNAKA